MMRMAWLLAIALLVMVLLALFPSVADQQLRIEAFGWMLETRQGAFIVALLALLLLLNILRGLARLIIYGPAHAWQSLHGLGKRREEKRLQKGLTQWINMQGDQGRKALRRPLRIVPGWLAQLLATLPVPPHEQQLRTSGESDLRTALAARIATEPDAAAQVALEQRKTLAQAWLRAFPDAPLARLRMADVLHEEGACRDAVEMWEALQREGALSQHVRPRLLRAYTQLAEQDPDHASLWLKKACDLSPEDSKLALRLGRAWLREGQERQAIKLWLQFLEQRTDRNIALALLEHWRSDALSQYRKLDKRLRKANNAAILWLKAELAHAAGLEGLAREHIEELRARYDDQEARLMLAHWHMDRGEFRTACELFDGALRMDTPTPSS